MTETSCPSRARNNSLPLAASHRRIGLSLDPEASAGRPSSVSEARLVTEPSCPSRARNSLPLAASHKRIVPSSLPEASGGALPEASAGRPSNVRATIAPLPTGGLRSVGSPQIDTVGRSFHPASGPTQATPVTSFVFALGNRASVDRRSGTRPRKNRLLRSPRGKNRSRPKSSPKRPPRRNRGLEAIAWQKRRHDSPRRTKSRAAESENPLVATRPPQRNLFQ